MQNNTTQSILYTQYQYREKNIKKDTYYSILSHFLMEKDKVLCSKDHLVTNSHFYTMKNIPSIYNSVLTKVRHTSKYPSDNQWYPLYTVLN